MFCESRGENVHPCIVSFLHRNATCCDWQESHADSHRICLRCIQARLTYTSCVIGTFGYARFFMRQGICKQNKPLENLIELLPKHFCLISDPSLDQSYVTGLWCDICCPKKHVSRDPVDLLFGQDNMSVWEERLMLYWLHHEINIFKCVLFGYIVLHSLFSCEMVFQGGQFACLFVVKCCAVGSWVVLAVLWDSCL